MPDNDNQQEVILKGNENYISKMQKLSDEEILHSIIIKSSKNIDQIQQANEGFDNIEDQIISPLYDPLLWASLMEKNTRLSKLVRTYARNTVGLGWSIDSKKPITKETTEEQKKEIKLESEKLEELFEAPSPDLPFSEIMYQVKVDEESTGNGYLEVSRNLKGDIDGLYHIPAHTIRLLKNLKGFVQIRGAKKVYFKNFGGDYSINMKTGEIEAGEKSVHFSERANEIIHFKVYTPRDSYYGIPRYVACADAIAGNKLAARRNLAFFKNDATPRMAITVTNGKLSAQSIEEIHNFVDSQGKGEENAHRVMVLQAKAQQNPGMDQKDVKIDVIPLTVGVSDDASHIKYRNANDEELREAFGIGEVFLGAGGSVNRATAMISRSITNEQEFIPDARVKEYIINQTICKQFGVKLVKLTFERPNSLDELDRANIFARYLQGGGVTPNDIRHELGKQEYDEDWADMPIQLAMMQYQMSLIGDIGEFSENGEVDEKDNDKVKSIKIKRSKLTEYMISNIEKLANKEIKFIDIIED